MNEKYKWLLLIPVVLAAGALAYFIPQWLSEDSGEGDDGANGGVSDAVQLEIDQSEERVEQYTSLLATNPEDPTALKGLGDAQLEKGLLQNEDGDINGAFVSFKSAVDAYQKYLVIFPDDADARTDLGFTYFNLLMFEIAERELVRVTAASPSYQRGWLVYGVILSRMEKTDQAVAAWQAAYDLDPNSSIGQEAKTFIDQAGTTGTLVPPGP